ncbi:hypothetical protein MD484_g4037, partial [Candolleomyces efflorescens]
MNTFLPPEILREIFTHYVHDRAKGEKKPARRLCVTAYPDSQTHPADLAQVCHFWRVTAISIPELWDTIYVSKAGWDGCLKTFKLWLERSAGPDGTHPLNLTIKQGQHWSRGRDWKAWVFRGGYRFTWPGKGMWTRDVPKQIICLAISQHRRWRYASLELMSNSEPLLESLNDVTEFPILRGFEISLYFWTSAGYRRLVGSLCSSPVIQSVTFGRGSPTLYFDDELLEMTIVPWNRLSTLNFTYLAGGPLLQALSFSAPTLQHVSVFCLHDCNLQDVDISHLTMPHLHSVHISEVLGSWNDIGPMFDKLTLPSLRTLRLPNVFGHSGIADSARAWQSLLDLLERSDCNLQVLEIGIDDLEPPASAVPLTEALLAESLFLPIFHHISSLRVTSEMGRQPNSLQLLDALSEVCPVTQRPRMLPLLETLVLDSVRSIESVRMMALARVAGYGGFDRPKLRRVSAGRKDDAFALDMDLSSHACSGCF